MNNSKHDDTWYIRKGVEQADGFEWDIGNDVYIDTQYGRLNFNKDEPMFLDHLTAQLTRQVDALDGNVFTDILILCMQNKKYQTSDRTMNTLKAIIDSGVLEDE